MSYTFSRQGGLLKYKDNSSGFVKGYNLNGLNVRLSGDALVFPDGNSYAYNDSEMTNSFASVEAFLDQVGTWKNEANSSGGGSAWGGITGTITDQTDLNTYLTKVDGIETGADVTDETNVKSSLDGATISNTTVASGDKVLIQDVNDSDNLKTVTAQSIANLATGGSGTYINVTPATGYADEGTFEICSYSKDSNTLFLTGVLERTGSGLTPTDSTLFTLPAGYRPTSEQFIQGTMGASPSTINGASTIRVKTTGEVTLTNVNFLNTNDLVRINGIIRL